MPDFLADAAALEAHLGATSVPFKKLDDGALVVAIQMMAGVNGAAVLRWGRKPRLFECVTQLPIPFTPERRPAIAGALVIANRALPASAFVVTDKAIHHVANAFMNEDGTLSTKLVDMAIASTRVACDRHFKTLLGVAMGTGPSAPAAAPAASPAAPRTPPLVSHVPARLAEAQLAALRVLAEAERPTFAPRLQNAAQLLVEEVKNPWFKTHRILFVQSPSPMPALGIMVAMAPDGTLKMVAGKPDVASELARAEGVTLADEAAARPYANVVTSWTRRADFPEMPVASFDEIPFRPTLSEAEKADVERLRGELAGKIAPLAFGAQGEGWRLDVWLVSVSRLIHRVTDVARDGSLTVTEDVVADLPVFPGRAWGMVNGRLVPTG